ncbi:MAG: hypothetical protein V9H25_20150 [Candidatus Competibacter sp.]
MGQPGADVVALGQRKDLRFVLQAPKRRGKYDAVEIALKVGARLAVGVLAGQAQADAGKQAVPVHAVRSVRAECLQA